MGGILATTAFKEANVSTRPMTTDVPTISESGGVRYLHFGSEWVQGAMWVRKPTQLILEYTAQMMSWLLFLAPPASQPIAQLGLGAGSLARFCLAHLRNPLEIVEWNPLVTAACATYFRLPRPERLTIDHDDAAHWVRNPARADRFAALMVDLYDGQARGPVRGSQEFYADCRRSLASPGVLTVNLFGAHESFARNIRNLSRAFEGRILTLPQIDAGNQIVLAFKGPALEVPLERLLSRAEQVEARFGLPARRWARSLVGQSVNGILSV